MLTIGQFDSYVAEFREADNDPAKKLKVRPVSSPGHALLKAW